MRVKRAFGNLLRRGMCYCFTGNYRVLRPGGVVGVRIPDWDGLLLAPADPLLLKIFEIVAQVRRQAGGDMYRGKYLRRLLQQVGFRQIQASASYDCHGTPESIRGFVDTWFPATDDRLTTHPGITAGLVDERTLRETVAAWQRWASDPAAFLARSFCEAIGWRNERHE